MKKIVRCAWAESEDMAAYHDTEWSVPSHDDRHLFEMLILEGAQAGLSWSTILKRRATYRIAYDNFDVAKIAKYTDKKAAKLLQDPGIIRNRAKVAASIANAKVFLKIQDEFGSFDNYLWAFVSGKPIQNNFKSLNDLPASSSLSDKVSKDLKKRGFGFVGSTICYAFMQAVGIVNDHTTDCFRHKEIIALRG